MAKSMACILVVLLGGGCSFVPRLTQHHVMLAHYSTAEPQIFLPTAFDLTLLKSDLVKLCCRLPKASLKEVQTMVQEVEGMGEQLGFGQCSSSNGLLSGEWELLYSPEDVTRSSPFFWAFRQAFPEQADEIFSITDNIPAPLKEVGPAFQVIDFNESSQSGRFVSKVKVATLGGFATSIMTTRASITGVAGLDGIKLKIETTKPEDSSVVQSIFGPLGAMINENVPAFPSGEVLEKVQPGSSEVILRSTYCDESLRISRNDNAYNEVYVWRRREFASFEML